MVEEEYKTFSTKEVKKKPLVEKDIVENCCELRNIIELPEMMMNLKLKVKLGQLLRISTTQIDNGKVFFENKRTSND
jgi:hypothetical protein